MSRISFIHTITTLYREGGQFTVAPATRRELCAAFQASTENISIRELSQPRRIVTVCCFAP